jgi:hypothetical protein
MAKHDGVFTTKHARMPTEAPTAGDEPRHVKRFSPRVHVCFVTVAVKKCWMAARVTIL